jgi:uridine kinase
MENLYNVKDNPYKYDLKKVNETLRENPEEIIKWSENHYNNQLDEAVKNILEKTSGRRAVMLAGPSSSGKTTTANILSEKLAEKGCKNEIISLDDFYKSREDAPRNEKGELDFETIEALNLNEMVRCHDELLKTGGCHLPIFDFKLGRAKEERRFIEIGEDGILIIEGLHSLNPLFVQNAPKGSIYKIYITVKATLRSEIDKHVISRRGTRLCRRILRDSRHRNCSPTDTLIMWNEVEEGENKYLFPYEDTADFTIDSFHPYELAMMKDKIVPLLEKIEEGTENYDRIERLLDGYKYMETISDDLLPENSLLREFLR